MPEPITATALGLDLSSRVVASTAVVGSPALAAETIVASVTLDDDIVVVSGVVLVGWLAFTLGTTAASFRVRIHQTGTSGTTVADSGALTGTAADLYAPGIVGFDTAPAEGQVYKLTLTAPAATAVSTVSAVALAAIAV